MGHIFISYSHKDSEYVHKLADALQEEGFEVWIDDRIHYGSEWPKVVTRNLDVSDGVIVVLSNNSYESDMVQNEVTRAREKRKPIFPLLLEGENWLIVQAKQFVDVRDGSLTTEKFYKRLEEITPRKKVKLEIVEKPAPKIKPVEARKPETAKPRQTLKPPFIAAIIGALIIILAIGASIVPQLFKSAPSPTTTATTFLTQAPISTFTVLAPSETPQLSSTPTESITIPPPPLPTEITDSKSVQMVLVPAGDFPMGDDRYMNNGNPDEQPSGFISLGAYYIDKYEVSNVLYQTCVEVNVCLPPTKTSSITRVKYYGDSDFDNYPVIYVNWFMAKAFCNWRGGRLPTEAEWEKSAGGGGLNYPWDWHSTGSTNQGYANFWSEPGKHYHSGFTETLQGGVGDTTPIDSYPQGISQYGIFNLAGNVSEWVSSLYEPYPYSANDGRENLTSSGNRVLRGGSWLDSLDNVRISARESLDPNSSSNAIGFRCAYTP
jgi:formylglycine-generating enzyme required for sulfatase activity